MRKKQWLLLDIVQREGSDRVFLQESGKRLKRSRQCPGAAPATETPRKNCMPDSGAHIANVLYVHVYFREFASSTHPNTLLLASCCGI